MQEEEDRGRTDVARNERENSGILGSENGDRGRATEEGERGQRGEREREREELAAEFVDDLLHVCQHVYVSR